MLLNAAHSSGTRLQSCGSVNVKDRLIHSTRRLLGLSGSQSPGKYLLKCVKEQGLARSVRTAAAEADVIDVTATATDDRLPVTILTGFLGSGKTTLLNTVLSQDHGLKVAIIENEFGAIDIDSSLIRSKQTLEGVDVVESLNGCICCTVRADLLEALENLIATKKGQFDHVIIETTGMADPRPIISIFTTTHISQYLRLDGVVTMVDAKNVERHLNDTEGTKKGAVNEALQQIAYADRIVLNKTDLVEPGDLDRLKQRVKTINSMAQIQPAQLAKVPVQYVLGVGGFDITRIEEEIDTTSSVANPDHSHDRGHAHHEEHHHEEHHHEEHHHHEESSGGATDAYHSHSASHSHGHDHTHDDSISSVAFTVDGNLDMDMVNDWLGTVLDYMSGDLFRYKGILAIEGVDQQYVFQGVHEQIQAIPSRDWRPDEKRRSQMVFIGRNINDGLLEDGFKACRAKDAAAQQGAEAAPKEAAAV